MTFNDLLLSASARDIIFPDEDYDIRIERAAKMIQKADYVLVGAGAGLSTAAGAQYGGRFFEENFGEFQEKYGKGRYMQDMYSAGFYPYPDEESFWGYWSKQALLGGIDADYTPLHRTLLKILEGKKMFILSTNADEQFVKAGLSKEKIFCTQGDYFHIQCAKGCHPKRYDAVDLFRKMDKARQDCKVPSHMVPKCPVCGGAMNMNLRTDNHFVEDDAWHEAESRFGEFISQMLSDEKANVVLLELGVGFNTPEIIKFVFHRLTKNIRLSTYICINYGEAYAPEEITDRSIVINADAGEVIKALLGHA